MQKLFITGVGGFIGLRLAELARERGLSVRGVDASPDAVRRAAAAGIAAEQGDVADAARMKELAHGADLVVHTAAVVRESGPAELFQRVNVEGSRNVALAAREGGAETFVQLSSVMVYGFDYPENVDEAGPLSGAGNPYCETKIASEAEVRKLGSGRFGVVVIRPGDVYGPGSVPWISRPLGMLARRRMLLPLGGRGVLNPVFVDDLVDGILLAATKRAHGEVFNVTDGHARRTRDYFGMLARTARLPPPLGVPKGLALGLAWGVGQLHRAGLTQDDASPATVRYLCRPHGYAITKARSVLGYAPRVTLDAGLERSRAFIESEVRSLRESGHRERSVSTRGAPS